MVKNLMAYDKNGDGKLSKDELPERMQGMLERGDTNKDGFLTPDEIRTMAQAQPGPGAGSRRRPWGRPRRPGVVANAESILFSRLSTSTMTASFPKRKSTLPLNPEGPRQERRRQTRPPWTNSARPASSRRANASSNSIKN